MMIIENKYDFGQTVYLVTDDEQRSRLVTGFRICNHSEIIYYLSYGTIVSEHYDFEISSEKNYVTT